MAIFPALQKLTHICLLSSGCNFDATKTNTETQTQIQNTVKAAPQYLFCEFVQYLLGVGL